MTTDDIKIRPIPLRHFKHLLMEWAQHQYPQLNVVDVELSKQGLIVTYRKGETDDK